MVLAYNEGSICLEGVYSNMEPICAALKLYIMLISLERKGCTLKNIKSVSMITLYFSRKKHFEYLNKIPRSEFSLVVHGVWNICQLDTHIL